MNKAAWHPFMDIEDDEAVDDVKLDIDTCVRFGDGTPVTELSLFGMSRLLTTEDENAIDDAASALAADFLHDFTFSTRH